MVEGYKHTEIGVIPEDWDVKKLSKVSNFKNGKAHELFIDENGKYIVVNSKFISTQGRLFKCSNKNFLPLRKGDITMVMSDIPNGKALAKCFLIPVDNKYALNQRICSLTPIETNNIFLYYILNRNKHYLSFDSGTGQTNLRKQDVENCPLTIPPLPEQKAIAEVLSDTDELIHAFEKRISKKRNIKQGAMQKLLTPKEGWETKKLGEVARYRRGSFPQPYGLPQWYDKINGTPFVQVYDVGKNLKLKETTKQKISDLATDKSIFVKKGNIILTIQGSIGRIAMTQYDAYVDRTLLIFTDYIVPMDKMFFLYIVLEIFRIEKQNAPGGIIKTITKAELSKFKISYPKLGEQNRIATILSDMDTEIERLEEKLDKYKDVKQGLMQQLLTGKIRLV